MSWNDKNSPCRLWVALCDTQFWRGDPQCQNLEYHHNPRQLILCKCRKIQKCFAFQLVSRTYFDFLVSGSSIRAKCLFPGTETSSSSGYTSVSMSSQANSTQSLLLPSPSSSSLFTTSSSPPSQSQFPSFLQKKWFFEVLLTLRLSITFCYAQTLPFQTSSFPYILEIDDISFGWTPAHFFSKHC